MTGIMNNTASLEALLEKAGQLSANGDYDSLAQSCVEGTITEIRGLAEGQSIGDGAFYMCADITAVTLPNELGAIGKAAFKGCTGISGRLKLKCTEIGEEAFYGCTGLTKVWISKNCATIADKSDDNLTVFGGISNLSIYTDAASARAGWRTYWNYENANKWSKYSTTYNMSEADFDAL